MQSKLLTLFGILLIVAGCETATEETIESGGEGAASTVAGTDVVGADTRSSIVESGNVVAAEVAAVDPVISFQEKLVQQAGDRVFFDFDKAVVRSDGEETLRMQATFLKQNPGLTMTIAGHCDERGTREYNLALGERRANAARNYLISLGISPGRLSTISYGKERPIVLGHNEAAWAQNRVGVSQVD
ncbi:MAG: peptidoglycan-associated lipoprotein [Rhodospirillaceae bacterium]|nr:peptidoglycan-associated lipoprotein [Rhodospirillaceae bacterium]|tara:strand:- start:594 stop:1154 length:561 start_codon:yes stop_codon:yes gene_type:complete